MPLKSHPKLIQMPNTFSQIYLHFVLSIQYRQAIIPKTHKEELHKYITGLVRNRKAKMLAVNCMPDHTHLFVGYNPSIHIPDFIKEIKVESNKFITDKKWIKGKFNWQESYGVFSYSHSHIDHVIKYINNQEEHHKKISFREEYLGLLRKFDISFDDRFLFEFFD
jgi:REP element-mobilizing transposase RayT